MGTSGGKDKTGASLQGDESDILEGDDAVLIEETLALQISRNVIAYCFGPGAPVLAYLKFRQERDPSAVAFQREVYKQFITDGTVSDLMANQADLKKLTQDVGIPINEEYTEPYLPVADAQGNLVTGELVKDSAGDVIGARTEQPIVDCGMRNAELKTGKAGNPNFAEKLTGSSRTEAHATLRSMFPQ
ncbi:MAG: hypothetical protein WCO56_26830, partial [Verrucomicrobiota bacterium]